MSVSYAVDFASLLLLGPHETMIVAAASAFEPVPSEQEGAELRCYRTLFSMASLVVTVEGAGLALQRARQAPVAGPIAALGAAARRRGDVYFLVNTGLVATAIALATARAIVATWQPELPVERAELFRRRRHAPRSPRAVDPDASATGWRR